MNPNGRPVGSKTKIKGSVVADVCNARGIDLVAARLDIAESTTDERLKDSIFKDLMLYVYAKRRDEDSDGKPADYVSVPLTNEETAEYIRAARGDRPKN